MRNILYTTFHSDLLLLICTLRVIVTYLQEFYYPNLLNCIKYRMPKLSGNNNKTSTLLLFDAFLKLVIDSYYFTDLVKLQASKISKEYYIEKILYMLSADQFFH